MPTKICLITPVIFPVVMYGCESWTIKKAEHRRIDAFELWCWRRLLKVPWTARRSSQSILKEISPGCSLEGLMLKLKLQYFGHLMWRADSFEKTLMLGKWGQEEKGTIEDEMVGWHHRFNGHRFGWTPGVGDGQGGPVYCGSWGCKESDTTEWLNCYLIDLKKKSLEELFIRKSGKLSWQGKSCWHNVFSLICHRHLVNDFGGENFKSFFNKAHDAVKI